MKKELNVSLILSLVVMALALGAFFTAQGWPLKAALFPTVIGIPLFLLACGEFVLCLLGKESKERAMDIELAQHVEPALARRRTAIIFAWIYGFFLAIFLAGFYLTVPLLVFLYLKFQGREGWVLSLLLTALAWLFFYGLFDRLLHLPFPQGWLFYLWA